MKTLSITWAGIFMLTIAVHATDFHISPRGDDGNDGSLPHPFQTISTAALAAYPGDTIPTNYR